MRSFFTPLMWALRAFFEETHNGKESSANWGKMLLLAMAVLIATGPQTAIAAPSAADLYAEKCAACHGTTGNGDGPAGQAMSPPPVPFSTALKGKSDSWISNRDYQGWSRRWDDGGDAASSNFKQRPGQRTDSIYQRTQVIRLLYSPGLYAAKARTRAINSRQTYDSSESQRRREVVRW